MCFNPFLKDLLLTNYFEVVIVFYITLFIFLRILHFSKYGELLTLILKIRTTTKQFTHTSNLQRRPLLLILLMHTGQRPYIEWRLTNVLIKVRGAATSVNFRYEVGFSYLISSHAFYQMVVLGRIFSGDPLFWISSSSLIRSLVQNLSIINNNIQINITLSGIKRLSNISK